MMMRVIITAFILFAAPALAYDYADDARSDCLRRGLNQRSMFGAPLCEVISVELLTKAQALDRGLWFRAPGWGKRIPANEDGYFVPSSGEFIPGSWALTSPDRDYHRCTYRLNEYWSGPPDNQWKVRPHSETVDGKPPTLCFWRP